MARVISEILNQDRVQFRHVIDQWEKRTGMPAHDIKLYSDLKTRAITAIRQLGLDPTDTISGELYFALQERARQDNLRLSNIMGISVDDNPNKTIKKIIKWINKNSKNLDVWMLKPAVVKAILKKNPPKNVMKSLGLRSVDSMLKRSNVAEILSLSNDLENETYNQKLINAYSKVKINDFDTVKVTFEEVDASRIEKLQKAEFNIAKAVIPNYVVGSVTLIPPKNRFPLDVLAVTMVIAEVLMSMRSHSAYYRTISMRSDFGERFAKVCEVGLHQASSELGEIGWNSIHKHLVGNEDFFSAIEQPFLTIDEFRAEPAVDLLMRAHPDFAYWKDLDYVFYHYANHAPVSLNLIDVVVNGANRNSYRMQSSVYGRARLWEELWARYLTHDDVSGEIINNFVSS